MSQNVRQQVGIDALQDGSYKQMVEFNRYAAAQNPDPAVLAAGLSILASVVEVKSVIAEENEL
jgi:hypothetical protein